MKSLSYLFHASSFCPAPDRIGDQMAAIIRARFDPLQAASLRPEFFRMQPLSGDHSRLAHHRAGLE